MKSKSQGPVRIASTLECGMRKHHKETRSCPECGAVVQMDDQFCPECGTLSQEKTRCRNHPSVPALGVCIVCAAPFCSEGLSKVQPHCLCREHKNLEISEGMARVFGNSDAAPVGLAKSSLEEAGFHPMIYLRQASPLSTGGPDDTLSGASGEYDGHIISEFNLMVP